MDPGIRNPIVTCRELKLYTINYAKIMNTKLRKGEMKV